MRTGRIFFGLVILIIGVVLLLGPLGIIPDGTNIWKFIWPSLIILLGVWFLVVPVFYRGRKLDLESLSIPLEDGAKARIRLKHGAGKLDVSSSGDDTKLVEGEFGGGVDQSLFRDGEAIKLKLRTPSNVYGFNFGVPFEGLNWKVKLNKTVPVRLDIDSGASDTNLDLRDMKLTELNINTGASSTSVRLPDQAGLTKVRIDSGAASVSVRIPENVAARIRVESGLAGIDVDTRRFHRVGRGYESPDYDEAENKADIFVKTGVGSLDIR